MKRKKTVPLTEQKWEGEYWRHRCAWCEKRIKPHTPVFGVSVSLGSLALAELEPGSIAPMLLAGSSKVVAMMVVAEDSPAKRDGKDAMFQLCSEDCAKALRDTVRTELGELPQ